MLHRGADGTWRLRREMWNAAPKPALPEEVTALRAHWETCWHFSGEEPYDAERRKQIADGQAKSCPGNAEERERLRVKWKDRADVQKALRDLDEMR